MVESLLMVLAISLDSFAIGLAYGTKNIRLPKKSLLAINIVCTTFLAVSIFFGSTVKNVLHENTASIISLIILVILGSYYLLDSILESFLKKGKSRDKKIKFEFPSIQIIIDIAIDGTKADINKSGDIDLSESIYLAIALSLDALAVGFGSSLGSINIKEVLISFFFINILAITSGFHIGNKIISKAKINLSWISGLILIFLGLSNLF
ncbi:MAG TPA: sporulation membrane protein YtaF [Tissierellales bacterium]|nr:sporulation membrane protein YtaF [Tissierellales bacterium]